jgi:replicative DNA helicase
LLRKQRNGPIGELRLNFRKQFTRFENWTGKQAPG